MRRCIFCTSLAVHIGILLCLWLRTFWQIDRVSWIESSPLALSLERVPEFGGSTASSSIASERTRSVLRNPQFVKPKSRMPAKTPPVVAATYAAQPIVDEQLVMSPGELGWDEGIGAGAGQGNGIGVGRGDGTISPPVPLGRYDQIKVRAISNELRSGQHSVRVLLDVDQRGRVVRVAILKGVTSTVDRRVIKIASMFRFSPARTSTGVAVASKVAWTFHVSST